MSSQQHPRHPPAQVPEANAHYAMAAPLAAPLGADAGLVLQYEAQITQVSQGADLAP